MRGPSNRIHSSLVLLKFCNWNCWNSNIQNYHFGTVHQNCGHVGGDLVIPTQSQERYVWFCPLINNSQVFFIPQIKYLDRTISWNRNRTPSCPPCNCINFFVMSNELGVYYFLPNVPNSACCVNFGWSKPLGSISFQSNQVIGAQKLLCLLSSIRLLLYTWPSCTCP